MECKDILNLIAIVVIPIAAVLIGQHLQNRAEIRKDKMHIFKVLMTHEYMAGQLIAFMLLILLMSFSQKIKLYVLPGKNFMKHILQQSNQI